MRQNFFIPDIGVAVPRFEDYGNEANRRLMAVNGVANSLRLLLYQFGADRPANWVMD